MPAPRGAGSFLLAGSSLDGARSFMHWAPDSVAMSMGGRPPPEVAPDQGYYEHALPNRDEEPERGPITARAFLVGRAFWLAAGILVGILFVGFFVWLWFRSMRWLP